MAGSVGSGWFDASWLVAGEISVYKATDPQKEPKARSVRDGHTGGLSVENEENAVSSDEINVSVALVTGGGRGLGRAFAQVLAAEGVAVAVTARSEDQLAGTVELIDKAGERAVAVPADVSDERAVEMFMFMASGRADSLSGRFISVRDDEDDLLRRAEEIQRDDLYTLRLRK